MGNGEQDAHGLFILDYLSLPGQSRKKHLIPGSAGKREE